MGLIVGAFPEVGHQQDYPDDGDRQCYEHPEKRTAERVIGPVQESRHRNRQEIERLPVLGIKLGEGNEVSGYAAPDGMKEREARQPRDIEKVC